MAYEKHVDFMRKHITTSKITFGGSYFFSNSQQETIQNILDPANTRLKNIGFKSKKVTRRKMNCYQNLIYLSFPPRKIESIKSKKNLKKFSPSLTRKLQIKIFSL